VEPLRPRTPRQPSTTARWFVRSHCAARERAARPILSRVPHRPATSPAVWCTPRTQLSSWSLGGDAAVPLTGGQDDGDASGASAPMSGLASKPSSQLFSLPRDATASSRLKATVPLAERPAGLRRPPPRLTLPHVLPLPTGLISQSKRN